MRQTGESDLFKNLSACSGPGVTRLPVCLLLVRVFQPAATDTSAEASNKPESSSSEEEDEAAPGSSSQVDLGAADQAEAPDLASLDGQDRSEAGDELLQVCDLNLENRVVKMFITSELSLRCDYLAEEVTGFLFSTSCLQEQILFYLSGSSTSQLITVSPAQTGRRTG